MALLRRKDDSSSMSKQRTPVPGQPGQVNIIGEGTSIEGGVTATSDLRIAGVVTGHVHVQGKTVVTPEGQVNGEIRTVSGDIAGRVTGDVIVEQRLVLKDTARVEGNLYTSKLVIEDGAVFTGSCDMSGALPAQETRAVERAATPSAGELAETTMFGE
jgi:cytoskeletal protein CcmA (bactofilin family)